MRISSAPKPSPPPPSRPSGSETPPTSKASGFVAVLGEKLPATTTRASSAPPTGASGSEPASATRSSTATGPSPVRAMLERAVGGEKKLDALIDAAAHGKTFTPGELLALQANVSRYSQTVEVVSRVADRLVGAVKQTMATQG
jgi:hypothetical protein